MSFSPSAEEETLLAQVRREQANWRLLRWMLLLGGSAASATGLIIRAQLARNFHEYLAAFPTVTNSSLLLASATTRGIVSCSVLIVSGLLAIAFALGRWRGSPATRLLLAVIHRPQ
jgi:hypothetical protein